MLCDDMRWGSVATTPLVKDIRAVLLDINKEERQIAINDQSSHLNINLTVEKNNMTNFLKTISTHMNPSWFG